MSNDNWLTPKEITKLQGMPTSIQGVHKKAKKENWPSRKHEGVRGPGVEYLVPFFHGTEEPQLKYTADNSEINQFMNEFVLIPGYSVQVSAGHGSTAMEGMEPSRFLAYRKKWLKYRGFGEKDLVIVWAKGDSMEPTIHNNDTLVINTSRKKPLDGQIFVIRFEESLWVKRVQIRANSWVLISDNALYPPIEIKHEEQSNFEIVGQVVNISKDIGD
ncbi:S24 family peptidase [Rheinheimera sp. KL1]|uniref:helix-turn-helix domain-containing protein n=1 Tax=Rheinheimera sp. KL1 TaxID=1635005 RepID=UPI000AA2CA78|nr:S24 family peptidase [Rheinheimera sp. KL1]